GAAPAGFQVDADLARPAVRGARAEAAGVGVARDAALVLGRDPRARGPRPPGHLLARRHLGLERDRGVGDVRRVDRRARVGVGGGCRADQHLTIVRIVSTIMTDEALAAAVLGAREAQGLSTSALAERSGVSRAMIAKIERAEAQPTAALLGRLSGALGLTLSELIARAEHAESRLARTGEHARRHHPDRGDSHARDHP